MYPSDVPHAFNFFSTIPPRCVGCYKVAIETVKRAVRLQSGSRWETKSIKIHKDGAVLKTNYDTFEKACAAAERMMN